MDLSFLDFTVIDPLLIVYAAVFLGTLMTVEGIRQVLSRGSAVDVARSRRMRMINAGTSPADVLALLRTQKDTGVWHHVPFMRNLPQLLRQAGMTIKPVWFLLLCLLATGLVYFVASRFSPAVFAAAAAVALCLFLPFGVLSAIRKKRMDKLVAQLPDALDLMARGLKVGHPLNTSIANVAKDMSDPIATEFGVMVDQVSFGEDIVTAFSELADRLDLEDVRYLAVSVGIQHGTGGNLARVLAVLAKVVRDRAAMRRKIKAISSEGRLSAKILSALPIVIFVATSYTAPDYFSGVRDDPLYTPLAVLIVAFVIANFLALRRLVNFRI